MSQPKEASSEQIDSKSYKPSQSNLRYSQRLSINSKTVSNDQTFQTQIFDRIEKSKLNSSLQTKSQKTNTQPTIIYEYEEQQSELQDSFNNPLETSSQLDSREINKIKEKIKLEKSKQLQQQQSLQLKQKQQQYTKQKNQSQQNYNNIIAYNGDPENIKFKQQINIIDNKYKHLSNNLEDEKEDIKKSRNFSISGQSLISNVIYKETATESDFFETQNISKSFINEKNSNEDKKYKSKWILGQIILISLFVFIQNYLIQITFLLQDEITDYLKIDLFQFNLLCAFYTIPSIFSLLLVSVFIYKLGFKLSLIIFSLISVTGQGLQFIAFNELDYLVFLAGIGLISIGVSGLNLSLMALNYKLFIGNDLKKSLFIIFIFSQMGTVASCFTLTYVYAYFKSLKLLYFYSSMLQISTIFIIIIIILIDGNLEINSQYRVIGSTDLQNNISMTRKITKQNASGYQFSKLYWIILVTNLIYTTMMQFNYNQQYFLSHLMDFSMYEAGYIMGVWNILPVIYMAICQLIYDDKIGRRSQFVLIVMIISFISSLIFLYLPNCYPTQAQSCTKLYLLPFYLFGIGKAIYSYNIQPLIAYSLKEEHLNTGFGTQRTFVLIGSSLSPLLFGYFLAHNGQENVLKGGFQNFFYLVLGLSLLSMLFSIFLLMFDKKFKDMLHKTSDEYRNLLNLDIQKINNIQTPTYTIILKYLINEFNQKFSDQQSLGNQ